jgi:uncharacterized coiled-coil protein SlyX
MYRRTTVTGFLAVAGLFAAACGPNEEQLAQLAELPNVMAERDRLQGEVERLTTEMGQVQTELSRMTIIPAPNAQGGERQATPDAPAAVSQLVAHVSEVEEQLTSAQARLRSVNATSAGQVQRISELEASIAAERSAIEGQRERISSLEASIANLEAETARQGEANVQLTRTVENMTDDANKVWYVVGTKEELIERGVIREEGGSRVLFIFGKRGKTIVPSRNIDPAMFTNADRRTLSWIPLPRDEEQDEEETGLWTVVTHQDLAAVSTPVDERGRVVGDALTISDPERFWANGRYLIIVRS